jgi:hypothetical protein
MTLLLGIYPNGCKSIYKRDTCKPVLIAALLTITELAAGVPQLNK